MKASVKDRVISFIEREIEAGLPPNITDETDLVCDIDWTRCHPNEDLNDFLVRFCHEFSLSSANWPAYTADKCRIRAWLKNRRTSGGPDIQHFHQMEINSLKVRVPAEMARTGEWKI